jgi:hypothetical protein
VVKSKLNAAIKEYNDHIQVLRADIVANRLSQLRINDRGESHMEFFNVDTDTQVNDDYFSATDDFCGWQDAEHKNNAFGALGDLARRQAVVGTAYNKLIDELTAPITRWKPI